MSKKRKELQIIYHNPNKLEDTADFLISVLVDTLVEEALKNPKTFFEYLDPRKKGEKS